MIKEKIKRRLFDIYMDIRNLPAWLYHCKEAGYEKEELEYLEKLDDEFMDYNPVKQANKWADEVLRNGGPDVYLSDDDEQKIQTLSESISDCYERIGKIMSGSWSYADIILSKHNVQHLEKLRSKIRSRHIHATQPYEQVAEWQITKAREYPLEEYLGIKTSTYIQCPFHEDKKPSFLVKGFGYCFSCQSWADSLKWLQTQENYSFRDAVKKLSGSGL